MTENGNYVTRAELKATVEPMRSDLTEVKADVKTLLAAQAGSRAVSGLLRHVSTLTSTLIAGGLGAALTLMFH